MVEVNKLIIRSDIEAILNSTPTGNEVVLKRTLTPSATVSISLSEVEWERLVNWVREQKT